MVDVIRLDAGAWMSNADEWTAEDRVRRLFGLGDRVTDAAVGVVKELLGGVWRIRGGGGG